MVRRIMRRDNTSRGDERNGIPHEALRRISERERRLKKKAREEGERHVALNEDSMHIPQDTSREEGERHVALNEDSMHIPQDTSNGDELYYSTDDELNYSINAKNDLSIVACTALNTFARLIARTAEEQHTCRKLQKEVDAFLNDMSKQCSFQSHFQADPQLWI